jgi:hypothetical protein
VSRRGVVAAVVLAAALSGCATGEVRGPSPGRPPDSSSTAHEKTPDLAGVAGSAGQLLGALPVKGRAPKTGYSREQFGQPWADVDRNGCDTRNDVLGRDLTAKSFKPGTRECVVVSGTLDDAYSANLIRFTRGVNTSRLVEIDHVVSLSNAWQTGAAFISAQQREGLANDPLNLLAVDGRLNRQKADSDAASWLPPNEEFRCQYVSLQVQVKAKYGLWVTPAEHQAIASVLGGCSA